MIGWTRLNTSMIGELEQTMGWWLGTAAALTNAVVCTQREIERSPPDGSRTVCHVLCICASWDCCRLKSKVHLLWFVVDLLYTMLYNKLYNKLQSSSVCHIRALCLNRSMDLDATWQVHLWGPMTHCVRWGPWPLGEGEIWRPAKTCSCKSMLPPGECNRGVWCTAIPRFTRLLWCFLLFYALFFRLICPYGTERQTDEQDV